MRLIKNTTELIGIKDPNIIIFLVFETDTHIESQAKRNYPAPSCPHCQGKMIKYDFQRPSKIPLLEQAGTPTLLRLKKRRFQCKGCKRVMVAETSIVEKNCQISNLVRQKVAQRLTEKVSLTDIARRLRVSTSTVYRKLDQFTFKEHYDRLPRVMSWDEVGFKKGELAFVAQNYETNELITILDNRRQTTIRNYFLKYPLKVRQEVRFITMDMSGAYIPMARKLFPNAKIVLDRFHIIQHLGRAFLKTRIAIMNQFDKKSLPYRALKNHWRLFQKDSRKLSLNSFYSKTFRQTLSPHEVVEKTLDFSEELTDYYTLYQLLLFHFQEKRAEEFFELIEENMSKVNHYFQIIFRTFLKHKQYIKNALETDYSNAKLEATNKLIKDIKRLGFGFRNFINFRKRVFITLNIQKKEDLSGPL
ncbi:ISL3-like element ISSmu2 family transposase [Streptococcus mutans]|jgi:Transposase and inactivated derivatives|uniref:Transposase, ISSmu2 n=1 Tax=Streptococcus mutans serotype c (strain ATCC 700610 / UA159) TaxID=210007 RepID=Q8DSH3_STRMU|nr:ISL3-like element ISSmu2 family transposase [Streptococcus mutans]AAN59437.1 putative transposase, ISSmu2 [Streptococcus mutans UA159]AJD56045.1 transposase, ISSmu2 [Streptococcus mutans UA159-FR]EMB60836.1 putative transposase, ISSmu2 [Streptococcus mutans 8ID3]EMB79205.1 putative transposase, ISSmu2 [Streptococcus mutans NFSM2]EMC15430.1 putative transposase, ISSmu2 [Streptococcus mutans N66]